MQNQKIKFRAKIGAFLKKRARVFILTAVFGAGALLGWYFRVFFVKASLPEVLRIGIKNNTYKFIDPLLGYDIPANGNASEFKIFENKINDLVDRLKLEGKVSDVGFYFRGLKSGYWLGVNEEEKFSPGSLMKVPLMMAYLKKAEIDPKLLSKQLVYDGKLDANQAEIFKAQAAIEPGKSYGVDELIRYMIVYSDNNAANTLLANVDQNSFGEVFADLGVDLPDLSKGDVDFMTPKQYALFLRTLRNSTYLNDEYSEKALELLASASFPQGLAAGLPTDATLAHKFGEYLFTAQNGSQTAELHDCGYVYIPKSNYFICVMTKGRNYNDLAESIKQLSSLTYQQVVNNFK